MPSNTRYPFAVRLIGFAPEEATAIEENFATKREQGYGYFCLPQDNLQDPDLFLANADEWKALVALTYLGPSQVRPVLLVGSPEVELPYACMPRPVQWRDLLRALDKLIEKRADALSGLAASDLVTVPERRRRDRLDVVLTDPFEYVRMRQSPVHGGVLIVDKNSIFSKHVAKLLARRNVPVNWANNESSATDLCKQQKISVLMINTSTPEVDAYRLCEAIKATIAERVTVIFLIDQSFAYDQAQARRVGCDGFLTKPLNKHHLMSALKKFLPQAN